MRVLLVEDDDTIASPLQRGLAREGFSVDRQATGNGALESVRVGAAPEVILLDLGLPDIDGFELCRELRQLTDVPVIVVTARGDEVDRVVGLELGADDYVVKPFGLRELVARIRAVSRRSSNAPISNGSEDLDHDARLVVDRRTREVVVDGRDVALTPKEFDLLALLAEDPGAVCSRQRILDEVWDPHWYGPTKTLDVHVSSLRRKLGDPALVETIRGVGYRLQEGSAARHVVSR
ncbi:MAG: response regulator transcription factor [Actinobacteria bacterium]|nr:response regulator transcription factor [Actinomycetota bacterium]